MGGVSDPICTTSTAECRTSLGYRRREPERTLLHATVRAHLKTFLAEMGSDGAGLPGFVISEFERYLACGILAHGFARVRCTSCGDEMLLAFSCKGRGF
jgi:Transposase zinc-binding domain